MSINICCLQKIRRYLQLLGLNNAQTILEIRTSTISFCFQDFTIEFTHKCEITDLHDCLLDLQLFKETAVATLTEGSLVTEGVWNPEKDSFLYIPCDRLIIDIN